MGKSTDSKLTCATFDKLSSVFSDENILDSESNMVMFVDFPEREREHRSERAIMKRHCMFVGPWGMFVTYPMGNFTRSTEERESMEVRASTEREREKRHCMFVLYLTR